MRYDARAGAARIVTVEINWGGFKRGLLRGHSGQATAGGQRLGPVGRRPGGLWLAGMIQRVCGSGEEMGGGFGEGPEGLSLVRVVWRGREPHPAARSHWYKIIARQIAGFVMVCLRFQDVWKADKKAHDRKAWQRLVG